MELSNEQYGQILSWMDRQQRRVAELETENNELRRQLDDLRRGVGVSLVIQGRALPVSVLNALEPASAVASSAIPVPAPIGEYLASSLPGTPVPAPRPTHPAYPTYSAPRATQAPITPVSPVTPQHQMASRATPAPDSTWLTGKMRTVRPTAPQSSGMERQRTETPSHEMTPNWLREDTRTPTSPIAPRVQSWLPTPLPATPKPRTLASATGKQQAVRPPLRQEQATTSPTQPRPRRSTLPHLEPEHLPSLAQMTGRQPAVRIPGKPTTERTPFSDSFVLG